MSFVNYSFTELTGDSLVRLKNDIRKIKVLNLRYVSLFLLNP